MKLFRFLLLAVLSSAIFFGCKKTETIAPAIGTLKNDSTGDCLASIVHGVYFPGAGLLASNYIDVQADIKSAGNYSIKTDTVNGYFFEGSGRIGNTGLNMIRLYAHALPGPIHPPYAAGIDVFTVQFDSTNTAGGLCTVEVTVVSSSPQTSVYTPDKDVDGGCLGAIATGVFEVNKPLDSSNAVSLRVNVLAAGTYDFSTVAVDGITFSATGLFISPGVQTIKLIASGVPQKEGIYNVSVKQGATSCKFSITVVPYSGTDPVAAFSLGGAPGNCGGFAVAGSYTAGTLLTAANTVSTEVNVTTIGAYSITTPTVNGVRFAGSGTFTTTGVQTVQLTAFGTPLAPGTFNYNTTGGGSACAFSITYANFPTGGGTNAVFTYGGAPGACTGFAVGGTYTAGTNLTPANTATIQVNVTTVGNYIISTNNVNGISFSTSGTFVTTGVQSVTLIGAGTPAAAGDNTYLLASTGDACSFIVTTGAPAPPAVFTASADLCSTATVNGAYATGSPLSASNTITISVNVTTIGSYSISTTTANGMTFGASGVFATTGVQSVTLTGSGTPAAPGDISIPIMIGATACNFTVTVTPPVVGAGTFTCKIDGVFTAFNDRAAAKLIDAFSVPYLYLDGYTAPPNGQNIPEMQLFINKNDNSAVTPGSYNVDGFVSPTGYRIEVDYHAVDNVGTVVIWNTSSTILPPPNPAFTITVTSITATRVTGTFSGQVKEISGSNLKTITEGIFDLPIVP